MNPLTPRQTVLAFLCFVIGFLLTGHIGTWPSALAGIVLWAGSDFAIMKLEEEEEIDDSTDD